MAPPLLLPREGESGGISVGWLLAIALGGGALLFVSVAFILISLIDRRNHRAQLAARARESHLAYHNLDGSSTENGSGSSHPHPPSGRRRRLTKSPHVTPARSQSSDTKPFFPRLASSGSLSHFFALPKKNNNKPTMVRRNNSCRTNSWVDEDAIHGPKMGRPPSRDSKRIGFRDSWLILRSPTLPALLGFREEFKKDSFYQHQNYPLIPRPRPIAMPPQNPQAQTHGQHDEPKPVPRVPLVRTPSYELAEKRAAALRAGLARHDPQDTKTVPQGPRPPPAARIRQGVTESDLHEILRNTAQRLQDGSPSPNVSPTRIPTYMPTRHRRTSSVRGSPIKLRQPGHDSGTVPLPQTPSPQKMGRQPVGAPSSAPAAMYHGRLQNGSPQKPSAALPAATAQAPQGRPRNMSQSSVISDTDSLFGESIPGPEQTVHAGLSSPSRRGAQVPQEPPVLPVQQVQPDHQRRRSMSVQSITSSVSSALSTVYSENESEEESRKGDARRNTLHPNLPVQPLQKSWSQRRAMHVVKMSDPFSSTPSSPVPRVPAKSPRRPFIMPQGTKPSTAHTRKPSSQDGGHPLGSISGNAQATPESVPIMSSLALSGKIDPARRDELRLSMMMTPPPPDRGGLRGGNVRPQTVAIMKPTFLTTSSSAVSMQASPSTPDDDRRALARGHRPKTSSGTRSVVIPPPLNLRPVQGSPPKAGKNEKNDTAARSQVVVPAPNEPADKIASPLSSPTLHGPRPLPDPHRQGTETAEKNDNSPSRGPSNASDSSSRYSDARSNPHHGSNRSSAHFPTTTSKRETPPRFPSLHASIIQLRRMGSQVSTHSRASMLAAPDSPTIPALRGGGFSPERSNSRAGRVGRTHYLNLGGQKSPESSPRSSPVSASRPRQGRCIKNARDSIDGPRRKAGSTKGENRTVKDRPAQIVEERENNSREHMEQQGQPGAGGGLFRRSSLKGSFRSSESPRRRLSVRFAEVESRVLVQNGESDGGYPEVAETERGREQDVNGEHEADGRGDRTPTKRGRQEIRASKDSLGLYDKDGFLMSSPERLPSSVVEGRQSEELRI